MKVRWLKEPATIGEGLHSVIGCLIFDLEILNMSIVAGVITKILNCWLIHKGNQMKTNPQLLAEFSELLNKHSTESDEVFNF